jgi:hypothetical protein
MFQNYLFKSNIKILNHLIHRNYLCGSLFLKNNIKEYNPNKKNSFIRNVQIILFHKTSKNSLNSKFQNDEDNDNDIKNLSTKDIQMILNNKLDILKDKNILIYESFQNISLGINLMGLFLAILFTGVVATFVSLPGPKLKENNNDDEKNLFQLVLAGISTTYFKVATSLTLLILGNLANRFLNYFQYFHLRNWFICRTSLLYIKFSFTFIFT